MAFLKEEGSSRTVSRTGIEENTSKEHERNALPGILKTMSQIPLPDVTQELVVVWAMHALLAAAQRNEERLSGHDCSPN
jgi:hypothetical protein